MTFYITLSHSLDPVKSNDTFFVKIHLLILATATAKGIHTPQIDSPPPRLLRTRVKNMNELSTF